MIDIRKHYIAIQTVDGTHVACCRLDKKLVETALKDHTTEAGTLTGFEEMYDMYVKRTKFERMMELNWKADDDGSDDYPHTFYVEYTVLYDLEDGPTVLSIENNTGNITM